VTAELKELALNLLELYRKQPKKLGPDVYFARPCQLTAIFVKKDNVLFIIAKHDSESKDKEINIHTAADRKALKKLLEETILKDAYWKNESILLSLTSIFAGYLENFAQYGIQLKREKCIWGSLRTRWSSSKTNGCVICSIDPETETVENIVDCIERKLKQLDDEHFHLFPKYMDEYKDLFVAFWYPPLIFDDYPIRLNMEILFENSYKNHRVFFTNMSQICILIPIKPPFRDFVPEALECLNEIIGVSTIFGIDGLKVTADDIHNFTLTADLKEIVGYGRPGKLTLQRYLMEETIGSVAGFFGLDRNIQFRKVTKERFVDLLKKTEKIVANKELKSYISLCLDAKTHFLKQEMKTAFLLSWIVIEKYIDSLWAEYLSSQNTPKKRFDKLTKSMLWSADDKLETLNLLGQISNDRYSQIARLKSNRNKVVHEERKIVSNEAKECNELGIKIVQEIIRVKCFIE
jgi:hypothetical protein